ncbi:hypothetical protein AC231_14440 [Clostridium pasteurianum]|nr:hypothetical protein AC231_14440 [Clostridium pasteurianum]
MGTLQPHKNFTTANVGRTRRRTPTGTRWEVYLISQVSQDKTIAEEYTLRKICLTAKSAG